MNLLLAAASGETARIFIELGAVFVGLALLARVAHRFAMSPVPLYLVVGLAFGEGGLTPLSVSAEFAGVGAEIGVVLLLFMLGLEYGADELMDGLRRGAPSGLVDFVLNFTPGWLAGIALGWTQQTALLLGGVTYISSSGVIAKLLADLDRLGNRETPTILTILVIEDLVMALYLPLVVVVLLGEGPGGMTTLFVALLAVAVVLLLALRFGKPITRAIASQSSEALLLMVFGVVLLVAGVAQRLQVSSAVGAFLVGIALSDEVAVRIRPLVSPLRDLFAAVFFVLFALQIDPATIPPVAGVAVVLAVVTAATKIVTGWWAAGRIGVQAQGRLRAGTALIARGEFSIVIAGLGVAAGVEPELGPLAATYVLLLAIVGPLLARVADHLGVGAMRARRLKSR